MALKYPDLFGSVTAHGSACNLGHSVGQDADDAWKASYLRIFGPNSKGGDNDIFALARRFGGATWPSIRFDCGLDDPAIEENRAFHSHLDGLGLEHEYRELPGSHDWDYCDARLRELLQVHWETLGQLPH
ncbi:MAG: alpha/beta hydrolase-fold protein [Chloroflexota bacterium]